VKVVGSNIAIYANGEKILVLDDENVKQSGMISIGTDLWMENTRAVVEFDNLYITNIPE
jgi:hypothetical protein